MSSAPPSSAGGFHESVARSANTSLAARSDGAEGRSTTTTLKSPESSPNSFFAEMVYLPVSPRTDDGMCRAAFSSAPSCLT